LSIKRTCRPFFTLDETAINDGNEISLSGSGSLLAIGAGQTVTINNLTLKGYSSNTVSLVRINDGIFTMNGGRISGNSFGGSNEGGGGGVYIKDSTFTMNGGSMKNTTEDYISGYCVYAKNSTFTIIDGYIYSGTYGQNSVVHLCEGKFRMANGIIWSWFSFQFETSGGGTAEFGTFDTNGDWNKSTGGYYAGDFPPNEPQNIVYHDNGVISFGGFPESGIDVSEW